jgi:hypothetical protein
MSGFWTLIFLVVLESVDIIVAMGGIDLYM